MACSLDAGEGDGQIASQGNTAWQQFRNTPCTIEQGDPQPLFKMLYLMADSRLRDEQDFGGSTKAASLRNSLESAKRIQRRLAHPLSPMSKPNHSIINRLLTGATLSPIVRDTTQRRVQ